MLTEFALDNLFFESDGLCSKSTNRTFIDLWKKQGVLIFGQHQDSKYFLKNLKDKIPPAVYQDWVDAFSNNKIFNSSNSWGVFCDYSDYSELLSCNNLFKTGITEEVTAELVFNLPNFIQCCPLTSFEIVDIDNQHKSYNFNKSFFQSCADINHLDSRDKVWNDKFLILSKYNKNIIIIDHYFFRNFIDDRRNGYKTNLEFILEKLLLNGRKYNITILSLGSKLNSLTYNELLREFGSLNTTNLKDAYNKVELISCNSKYFQEISHDRFIQFDEYVCTLGKGLDVLREKDTPQCTFNMVKEENSAIRQRISLINNYKHWEYEFLP